MSTTKKAPAQPGTAAQRGSYHHGDLKGALIKAADEIIRESGVENFSLREAARRAGVAPSAPTHHFGNAVGLLTEVALVGYEELGKRLAAVPLTPDIVRNLRGLTTAYVRFALDNPGCFRLMFRKDLVNRSDPRYKETSLRALRPIAAAALAVRGCEQPQAASADYPGLFSIWATVHGIAHLAIEDKMQFALEGRPPGAFLDELLPAILDVHWPVAG